jgi:hypothetical protein
LAEIRSSMPVKVEIHESRLRATIRKTFLAEAPALEDTNPPAPTIASSLELDIINTKVHPRSGERRAGEAYERQLIYNRQRQQVRAQKQSLPLENFKISTESGKSAAGHAELTERYEGNQRVLFDALRVLGNFDEAFRAPQ